MESNLYLVLRRDSMGAPTILVFSHGDDEQLMRSGNIQADDEVTVYVVTGKPRKYRVESALPPLRLVGI